MSEENVEIVRRDYDAAARRDAAGVFALYDPKVELDPTRLRFVDTRVYRGHDELRAFFREWHDAWESIDYDFDELIDTGEHVISVVTRRARAHERGRGRTARGTAVDDSAGPGRAGRVVRVGGGSAPRGRMRPVWLR